MLFELFELINIMKKSIYMKYEIYYEMFSAKLLLEYLYICVANFFFGSLFDS